jgi:cytochrome c553
LRPQSDPELLAKGERVYANRCADCHLDNGRESDKDAPLMAAQDAAFLVAQSKLFKTGARKFPFMMDDAFRGLTDADLSAVAAFFAAQDPVIEKRRRKRQ